jgi:hypothetical protein
MFISLKTRNPYPFKWHNMPNAGHYHISPGADTSSVKGNEADRMVKCRFCGWPCDKERDPKQNPDSWAGLGIAYGPQLTAAASIGDRRVPAAGAVAKTADQYHERSIVGGCPNCASYLYWT